MYGYLKLSMNKLLSQNMQYSLKTLLLCFLFFACLTSVNAEIIAEDSFEDYSVGNIAGNNSGTGWSGAWSTGSSSKQAKIIDTSTSPLEYIDSNGNIISGGDRAIEITQNNGEVAKRALSATYDNTEIYASMLIRFTGTQSSNDFLANWLESQNTNNPNFGIKMNLGSGGTDFFTRTKNGQEVYSTNIVNGQTYFLVMKVSKTGNTSSKYNRAQLWVNPTTLDTEPAPSTGESESNSNIQNFSTIGFRSVNLDNDDSVIVDRVVYGRTWEDVTGASEPNGLFAKYWNHNVVNNRYQFPSSTADIEQIESNIDYNWRRASPILGINRDRFAVKWEGELEALETGNYTFQTHSDDGVRLWVNNKLVIDNWTRHSPRWDRSAEIALTAGERYSIKMEYFEDGGDAVARLHWQTPSNNSRRAIPEFQLYAVISPSIQRVLNPNSCSLGTEQLVISYSTSMTVGTSANSAELTTNYSLTPEVDILSVTAIDSSNTQFLITLDQSININRPYKLNIANIRAKSGAFLDPVEKELNLLTGSGLKANYWNFNVVRNGYEFPNTPPDFSRIEETINNNWGRSQPTSGINRDNFAAQWTGSIIIPETGNYTFSTRSDDGVRLWLDNKLIIENWTRHGARYDNSAVINLTEGERLQIRMEFFENTGGAVAQLLWRTPSDSSRQIIPKEALYPCEQNLVKNGSFENPVIGASRSVTSNILDNWTLEAQGINIRNNVDGNAFEGDQFVELDVVSNTSISQIIDTENNQDYQLSFAYSPRINQLANTNRILVFWNDTQIAEITGDGSVLHDWQTYSYRVRGTGSDELKFSASGISDGLGGSLDDVVLEISDSISLDHFELHYSNNGLTCLASSVALKACQNSDCSNLYNSEVDITLLGDGAWSNNPIRLNNGENTSLTFQAINSGETVIGISNSSVAPTNSLQCYENGILDLDCNIPFADAGFIFTVPTLTACKTSDDIILRAVELDDETNQCVGALTGPQPVNFFSTYLKPSSGSQQVTISGASIDASSPGTTVNLTFNNDGEAIFNAEYDAAGQLELSVSHTMSSGTTLNGNDLFISKPAALHIYTTETNANCVSGDANCSIFKKTGENFDLKVKAACWQQDNDPDYSNNPATPNFELDSINVSSSIVAPITGNNATLSTANFDFEVADSGEYTLSQSVSEVGVFTFSVSPPSYFGESITVASSDNIGRFYPDHFKVTAQNSGAFGSHSCGTFTYTGQSFGYQTAPSLTVTAYNSANLITQNYTSDFAKLIASDFSVTAPTTDAYAMGADNTNKVSLSWSPDAANLTDNSDGSHSFSFGNDSYQYLKQTNSMINAFSNAVDLSFTAITDSDGVATQSLPVTLQPSGENIRFGRIAIANAYGSELTPLPIALTTEYFDGFNWRTNTADTCTALSISNQIRLQNAATNSGALQAGTANMVIDTGTTSISALNFANGQGTITFNAPGEDNQGYVDIQSNLTGSFDWLLDDSDSDGSFDDEAKGKASFGIFKGSDRIIFRREVY